MITVATIISTTAAAKLDETVMLLGQKAPAYRARQRAMFLARRLRPDRSYPDLGRAFGRDHTTVLYGVRRVAELLLQGDVEERWAIDVVLRRLGVDRLPPSHAHAKQLQALSRRATLLEVELERIRASIRELEADV